MGQPTWDEALRALVWHAYDRRDAGDDAGFRAVCSRIVDARVLWPLAEVEIGLARAERDLERRLAVVEEQPWLVHELFDLGELRQAA